MTGTAIQLVSVSKWFGNVKAVDSVNLEIAYNSVTVIKGPSGGGKTTLLRLIAGLENPDSGTIYVRGKAVAGPGYSVQPSLREIGFVFQTPALWPHLTVRQNILFGLRGKKNTDRLEEMLKTMEIEELADHYPSQLSGGQAKRVALARTLAPAPSIILMDEPLANMDSDLKHKLLHYISKTVKRLSATLLYVTHADDEAIQLGDKILQMRDGVVYK